MPEKKRTMQPLPVAESPAATHFKNYKKNKREMPVGKDNNKYEHLKAGIKGAIGGGARLSSLGERIQADVSKYRPKSVLKAQAGAIEKFQK